MAYFERLFMENSEERLITLVNERKQVGADRAAIDEKIWDTFGEDWTVMFTDLSGFSRHVAAFGIVHFLQVIIESEQLFAPILEDHNAFLLKREGDSLLVLFRRPKDALECAIDMQHACQKFSKTKPPEEKVLLCVGISSGTILRLGSTEVFGEAVNSASKLGEDTAEPHEILITTEFAAAYEDAYGKKIENDLNPLDFIPPRIERRIQSCL